MVSGRIEDGLRVLTIDPARPDARYIVYRGDYVRPELADGAPFTIHIPSLGVDMSVPVPEGQKPFFKVPDAGVFPFRIGDLEGEIEAVEYTHDRYREVGAREAVDDHRRDHPLILDVRTQREFDAGHLEDAKLIPMQVLAQRIGELEDHKQDPCWSTAPRATAAPWRPRCWWTRASSTSSTCATASASGCGRAAGGEVGPAGPGRLGRGG